MNGSLLITSTTSPFKAALRLYFEGLAGASQLITYKKDQTLFYAGHRPCGVIIILSGEVDLVDDKEHFKQQAPCLIPIGFDLIIEDKTYPFTATTQTDCVILFLSKGELQTIQDEVRSCLEA